MKLKKLPIPFPYILLIGFALSMLLAVHDSMGYFVYGKGQWYGWGATLFIPLINYMLWALLTPIIYHIFYLLPQQNLTISQKGIHLFWGIFIAFFHEIISNAFYIFWMNFREYIPVTEDFLQKRLETIPFAMMLRAVEYWIIIGGLVAIDVSKKFSNQQTKLLQIERDLSQSKLDALKMQLQPHFLFNTLNTISALMEMNTTDAQRVVSRLGHLLRRMLDDEDQQMVSLDKELQYIRAYLDIEQTRFSDRLTVDYNITEDALSALLPNLILQPLVENAIKHGISHLQDDGKILIKGSIEHEQLSLIIQDNGPGHTNPNYILQHPGIGISNVLNRLKHLYEETFEIQITSSEIGGFMVNLKLPID